MPDFTMASRLENLLQGPTAREGVHGDAGGFFLFGVEQIDVENVLPGTVPDVFLAARSNTYAASFHLDVKM